MIEYENLSEKAKEILNEYITDITLEELENEFKLMNQNRTDIYCGKQIHFNYDPVAIYMATQRMLINNNPSLAENTDMLIKQADELFPKRLMQCVLLAIDYECDRGGKINIDDYEGKSVFAYSFLNNTPVAYYPNIIEFINNEEYSDCLYHGISLKKVIQSNFPNLYRDFIADSSIDKQRYYKKEAMVLSLNAIEDAIKNNDFNNIFNLGLYQLIRKYD